MYQEYAPKNREKPQSSYKTRKKHHSNLTGGDPQLRLLQKIPVLGFSHTAQWGPKAHKGKDQDADSNQGNLKSKPLIQMCVLRLLARCKQQSA